MNHTESAVQYLPPPPLLAGFSTRDSGSTTTVGSKNELPVHCKPGEANTSLKTATCEAGPGTTHIFSFEICIWSLLIQEFVDGWCSPNSICDLPKCYLYIDYRELLNKLCQELNHWPLDNWAELINTTAKTYYIESGTQDLLNIIRALIHYSN